MRETRPIIGHNARGFPFPRGPARKRREREAARRGAVDYRLAIRVSLSPISFFLFSFFRINDERRTTARLIHLSNALHPAAVMVHVVGERLSNARRMLLCLAYLLERELYAFGQQARACRLSRYNWVMQNSMRDSCDLTHNNGGNSAWKRDSRSRYTSGDAASAFLAGLRTVLSFLRRLCHVARYIYLVYTRALSFSLCLRL